MGRRRGKALTAPASSEDAKANDEPLRATEGARVAYVIDDTPRETYDEGTSARRASDSPKPHLDGLEFGHDVATAASTGNSSSSSNNGDEHPAGTHGVVGGLDGPLFSKSMRRPSLSPHERQPRFMQPLRRESSSPVAVHPVVSEPTSAHARTGVTTDEVTVPVRDLCNYLRLFKPPTIGDMESRESSKRQRLTSFEREEFHDIRETYLHDTTALRATIQRREKYLKSFEYARCNEHGRQQRLRIEQWEAEKAKAEQDVPTFTPKISAFAAKVRPSGSIDGFLRASEQWVAEREKRRRASSAVVFREEETTFHPKVSRSSAKIAERMTNTSRRFDVVNGWTERLEAHKRQMEQLQEKYACSFQPAADKARRSLHPRRHHDMDVGRAKSASPKRVVRTKELVTRLYDTTLEMRRSAEQKRESERHSLSPKPVKRPAAAIMNHLKTMTEADQKAQHRIEKARHRMRDEEAQLEHNSHRPVVNPNSVALADLHRQRRSLSQLHTDEPQPSVEATSSCSGGAGVGGATSKTNIYDMLYSAPTQASAHRSSRGKASPPLGASGSGNSCSRERRSSQGPPEPSSTAARSHATSTISGQREFLQRNEKLLQTKEIHRRDLLSQLEEQESRECTFAPALSAATVRLAEYRRSSQRVDDVAFDLLQDEEALVGPSSDNVVWKSSLRSSEARTSPQLRVQQRSLSPKPTRPLTSVPFQRTDNVGPPYVKRSSLGEDRDYSTDAIHERMEDIEGLLRQWKWLEENSRM